MTIPYREAMTFATWSSKDYWTLLDSQHQAFILYTKSYKFVEKWFLYRKWKSIVIALGDYIIDVQCIMHGLLVEGHI